MSFRGRGRGRGYGGGANWIRIGNQQPFDAFPEVELPDRKAVKEERALVFGNAKLVNFWKSSPYYLEATISEKSQKMDIERFSDWEKSKISSKRDALSNFLVLHSSNFPSELIAGTKWGRPNPKKVRWDPKSDVRKWDLFEKLEQKFQGREDKGEEGEEDEDEKEIEAEEDLSDDDYNQNIDFDDDDDDYNDVDDGGDDEAEY